jgi:hypothetical protein
MTYYILEGDEIKGPYTVGQLRSMWNTGAITVNTLYAAEGYPQWLPMVNLLPQLEPPAAPPPLLSPQQTEQSSKAGQPLVMEDRNATGFLGKPGTLSHTANVGCATLILGLVVAVVLIRGCT